MTGRRPRISVLFRSPLRFLAVVLAVVFAAEAGVMFVLPYIFQGRSAYFVESLADASLLTLVFTNIIRNARQAAGEREGGGTVTVRSERLGAGDTARVRVTVADDGCGIGREQLGRIFDPFYTTRPVGKGAGLGLSLCHRIVAEHGKSTPNTSVGDKSHTLRCLKREECS